MTENILYSFRRCPYAIRARWAILQTGINVNLREIDLRHKPEELLELSPKGTVPVLLTCNGEIIDESLDIIYWALDKSSKLTKKKDNDIETIDLIRENDRNFKYHLDRFKYASRYEDSDVKYNRSEAIKILYRWNNKLSLSANNSNNRNWLVAGQETIADWAIWPFVRQYYIADPMLFETNSNLEHLKGWLYYYLNHELFSLLMKKIPTWKKTDLPFNFGA